MSKLFLDYANAPAPLAPFYSATPAAGFPLATGSNVTPLHYAPDTRAAMADLLEAQNHACHAAPPAVANIAGLRDGAATIVTGQQVGLFGGPLYTLHKAATAIRLAQQATAAGTPTVPIFWLATEDHDFAEVDHVQLSARHSLETIRISHPHAHSASPVGALRLGADVTRALAQAAELLGPGPELALLERCYRPEATFASAFAQWLSVTFREHGLIVLDASSRACHALGAAVLRAAITDAEVLEHKLLARGEALAARGYHSQVLVTPGSSLLFLLEAGPIDTPRARHALKRKAGGQWTAGHSTFTTDQLLAILDSEPERLSPNALLRPVFQDAILPTAAYVGGPAEIAYFAQTAVLHEHILGRVTPVLPRLSVTLLDEAATSVMGSYELSFPDILNTLPAELAQRIGARSMPVEGKRALARAGNAMSDELEAVTAWMRSLDEGLGRSADVAASKMRYQMNRLRRLAANYELQRDASITRHLDALLHSIYPGRHLQERSVGAASALSRYGSHLASVLVEAAAQPCPGHKTLEL